MIKQSAKGLNSRSEANPFDENGFIPLITAPIFSVVDESNYQVFLDNKIQVCLPRNETQILSNHQKDVFFSLSLKDFVDEYIENEKNYPCSNFKVCIDTANGNMPMLHEAIRKAKEIHGNNLVIMAGNVSSVKAFIELAKTGCDYIRVGVGGGSGCNTSLQTAVGQEDLEHLIECIRDTKKYIKIGRNNNILEEDGSEVFFDATEMEYVNIVKTKIVADGISRFVDQLVEKKEGLDNGYAAINRLLYAGSDLVMVGKLFAQCVESAGEKAFFYGGHLDTLITNNQARKLLPEVSDYTEVKVKYQGMSTKEAQMRYKGDIKPSEGKTSWINVKWTLEEWLNGSETDNDYLPGWVNSLKSAMSYTGSRTLKEFKL